MSKSEKDPVKQSITWTDPEAPNETFEHDAFLKRLKDVYGIDYKKTTGTRRMICHVDAADWFSYEYEWEIGGKKFIQNVRLPRRGQNKMNWSQ